MRSGRMRVEDIRTICNLGTGTMGHATALMFALAGYQVRLYGRTADSLERGYQSIDAALATYRAHKLIAGEDGEAARRRIAGVTTLEAAADGADFVIESIAEDLAVKREVFAKLDRLCPRHTIFATNTSGLSPSAIAEALDRKDKFVAANFWNPPHLLPLVEVMPGRGTSRTTVDITWQLLEKIGKKPVAINKETPGFIGNRLQMAMLREAFHIVESGIASAEAVDTAVKYSLGRRWGVAGPLESADMGGLDIFYHIAETLFPELCDSHKAPRLLEEAMHKGALGAKTGQGLYQWTPERLAKVRDKREAALIEWLGKDKQETEE